MKLSSYILVLFILYSGCSNDSNIETTTNGKLGERTTPFEIDVEDFQLSQVSNIQQAHQALSYAVSRAVYENAGFRNYIFNRLSSSGKCYNEILICQSKSDNILGSTLESILNHYLSELNAFSDPGNHLQVITDLDNLVVVTISDVFFRTTLNSTTDTLPVTSINSSIQGFSTFFNGLVNDSLAFNGTNLLSLVIKTSDHFKLIDRLDGSVSDGRNFIDLFGFEFSECSEVYDFIQAEPDYCGQTGKSVINLYNIQNLFEEECSPSNPEPDDPDDPDPDFPDCPRANWSKNYNSLEGMWLSDIASFNYINNQPCPGGEKNFSFHLQWGHGQNGTSGTTKTKIWNFTRNQVLNPGVLSYEEVPVFGRIFGVRIRIGTWRKPNGYIISPYPEYMNIHMPLFSESNVSENNWEPDLQGRYVKIKFTELDEELCTSTTFQSTNVSFNMTIQFGTKDKSTGSVGWMAGFTYNVTSQVTATAILDLGTTEYSYCSEYGFYQGYEYPDVVTNTGSIYLHLFAPKIQ